MRVEQSMSHEVQTCAEETAADAAQHTYRETAASSAPKGVSMPRFRIHVVGISPHTPLHHALVTRADRLFELPSDVEDGCLVIGFWSLHQGEGKVFRAEAAVTLSKTAFHMMRESGRDPSDDEIERVLDKLLKAVRERVDALQSARTNTRSCSLFSAAARSLRPLHGHID